LSSRKADALALQNDESVEALNRHEQRTINELLQNRDVLRREIEQQSEAIIQSNGQYHVNLRDSVLMALGEAQSSEIRLLQSLRFPTMGNRYVEISEAHRQTFRWVFEDPLPLNCGWSNFADWLENGHGVYWINGKAGSGKSTLMRYIFDSETTRWHLRKWATDLEPGIAGFFFWNSGSLE
jgi:type II secretory ATPase GspE/PulE/Tfp pilus assembly ATPase PilB-like protein